ncbi:hypothetical protein PBRA_000001 [Plasmodiophora brassicae]|uniref:Uncharacterized protein n=1 Tax=Plasmodiophora brassicae TaxID=37360 RepID=A0A0G4IGC2_PLABS|nr:hypothetical protein PBRA_000001 [Plasmodiophora brassicae]
MKMASALSKHTSLPTLRNQVQSISPQVAGGSKKTRAEIRLNDCSHTYKTAIMTGDDTSRHHLRFVSVDTVDVPRSLSAALSMSKAQTSSHERMLKEV